MKVRDAGFFAGYLVGLVVGGGIGLYWQSVAHEDLRQCWRQRVEDAEKHRRTQEMFDTVLSEEKAIKSRDRKGNLWIMFAPPNGE